MLKASFIVPSRNCAAWLPHAVGSVEKQTHKDVELIVVDDGSTDTTPEYLKWLEANCKIPLKIVSGLFGRSKARNEGNKAAAGDVLFVLDADDIASPDRAKKTLEKIEHGAQFVYGSAQVMDFSGTQLKTLQADVFHVKTALEKRVNGIVHSSVAYTKELALKFPYCEDAEISENGLDDWFQQLEISSAGIPMDFIVTPVCAYRVLTNAISATRDPKRVEEIKTKYLEKLKVPASC